MPLAYIPQGFAMLINTGTARPISARSIRLWYDSGSVLRASALHTLVREAVQA